MKTAVIPVCYNTEKLEALRQYSTETELQEGLEAVLHEIYKKYVPSDVQEQIEEAEEGGV